MDFDSLIKHRTYFQPSTSMDEDDPKIDSSNGPIKKHKEVWLGFNRGVRLMISDQLVGCSETKVVIFDDMFRD
jgi:hypothetical protein